MILECPACSAKFKVPDNAIGTEPKRIRCGKCKHMWTVKPPKPEGAEAEAQASDEAKKDQAPDIDAVLSKKDSADADAKAGKKSKKSKKKAKKETIGDHKPPARTRPVKKMSKSSKIGYAVAYVCLFALATGVWTLKELPDYYGFAPTAGFSFEQLEIEPMPQLGGDRFSSSPLFAINGVVRNVSGQPRKLPTIRVTLVDNEEEIIYTRDFTVHDEHIPPGDTISFTLDHLEQNERRHTHFIIEMGNQLEFALRDVKVDDAY